MRILCLHGYGTSGDILKGQMGPLVNLLDDNTEFVFLDGEIECPKAPGVGTFVEGPFLCYSAAFTPQEMSDACELVTSIIEEEGPFDGVLGFSQGGSLALAYLFDYEAKNPGQPPPFKFAILFSTVVAFSPDEGFNRGILESISGPELQALSTFPSTDWTQLRADSRLVCQTVAEAVGSAKKGGFIAPTTDTDYFVPGWQTSGVPRVIHPALTRQRIRIPTVHFTGKRDSPLMVSLSKLMTELCDKKNMKVLEHSTGHDLPKKSEDAKMATMAIEWAMEQSRQLFW